MHCILYEELLGVEQAEKTTFFVLDRRLSQGSCQFAYRRCVHGEHKGEINCHLSTYVYAGFEVIKG